MNANVSRIAASVGALLALLVSSVAGQAETPSASSSETMVAVAVHEGDEVVVNAADAALMVGDEVLARLPSGQTLPVTAVQGAWVGTSVQLGGKWLSGWIQASDVMLARAGAELPVLMADQPSNGPTVAGEPYRVTTYKPIIPEPQAQPVPANCVVPAQRSDGPGQWNYYWSGHHEPDPDIFTWEPWRHNY